MLTPSRGICFTPSTSSGIGIPTASMKVGTTSMMWWYWLRSSPFALMPLGQ